MKTQLINFTIPKELLVKVDELARKGFRSRSEVLREAARRLVDETKERNADFAMIAAAGERLNLKEDEAVSLIEQVRSKLQINR